MPDTAVVILNWNGKLHLEQFLPSVINFTPAETADIVVIDNASTDESIAYLQHNFPQIIIIKNQQNSG